MFFRAAVAFLLVFVLPCLGSVRLCADETPVFVIGFERFGRHQDIDAADAGALLISELSCTACHASSDDRLTAKKGPRLTGAGNRLRADWIREFVADPHAAHDGTTMPNMLYALDRSERDKVVNSIAAYLSSQLEAFPVLKAGGALPVVHEFWKKGDSRRGQELYHAIGCVACHAPDSEYESASAIPSPIDALIEQLDPEELQEMGLARAARRVDSISHGDLRRKYSARSLTMFLYDPASVRPDARMPSLRLQPADAADITAFLMGQQAIQSEIDSIESDAETIEAGRGYFQQFRCVNCHETSSKVSPRLARPLDALRVNADEGCLNRPSEGMPRYALDSAQVAAIVSFLEQTAQGNEISPSANSLVQHRMMQLNCYACHERLRNEDGELLGGVGRFRKPYFETVRQIDLGDEGRLPPPLTKVGRKLLPSALESVFSAKATPLRPFMTIRMPAYHQGVVQDLIDGFPKADEVDASSEVSVFGDPAAMADAGRQLVNTGCVECHAFRGESLPGAVGVDVHEVHRRVRPQWFLEFMRNPGVVKTRTRMPTFFPDGNSSREDLLGGDVDRQIAAIWHYLKTVEPLPEKIAEARSKDFELVPVDRPIILRTFMQQAGNHAIAVGLPGGLNFAFDSQAVRVAVAWKGRFLDARGTWFERFAPPAEPLGEEVVSFPNEFPFVGGMPPQSNDGQPKSLEHSITFTGYRVDAQGMPVFLYRFHAWDIEDRIEPTDDRTLKRTWTLRLRQDDRVDQKETSISWLAHAGDRLRRVNPISMMDENGLIVSVLDGTDQPGELLERSSRQQWLIPLSSAPTHEIKVEYRW